MAIQKIKNLICLGAKHSVRNGRLTRFWIDWWTGIGPLRDRFPAIFAITSIPDTSVAKANQEGEWDIPLRRTLGPTETAEWINLRRELPEFIPSPEHDAISWALEPSGKFSVRSLYNKLYDDTPRKHYSEIWGISIPQIGRASCRERVCLYV